MKLDLNIDKAVSRGRRAVPLEVEVLREIDESDLALLNEPGSTKAPALKRITDRHHSLARLLASGTPEQEAAAIVGYTVSRVSILKDDPAFQELLALYRKEVNTQFSTTLEHMAGLSRDALLELRDRMEESPEKFSNNELRALVTELNDRVSRDDGGSDQRLPDLIELVAPEFSLKTAGGESEEADEG